MGSSPIARSIFFSFRSRIRTQLKLFLFVLVLFGFFLPPTLSRAQVTVDNSRSFGQGQVLSIYGIPQYIGDLPEDPEILTDTRPYHTLGGTLSEELDWPSSGAGSMPGLAGLPRGIFFEGTAFPLDPRSLSAWIPNLGNVALLDFPASAWLGPSATAGAIQYQVPFTNEKAKVGVSLWGGSDGLFGTKWDFGGPRFFVTGNFQQEVAPDIGSSGAEGILSGVNWVDNDSMKIQSGLLSAYGLGQYHWNSVYSRFELKSPNFQSIQIKPFYQDAQVGSQTLQEYGGEGQYHFNMAGAVESQLGVGWSRTQGMPSIENLDKEFLQNTERFDVIGFANGNISMRWDFSNESNTTFSLLAGAQGNLGDWVLLGDYAKGVLDPLPGDTQRADLGARYDPGGEWMVTGKLVAEMLGSSSWDGGSFQWVWDHKGRLVGFLDRLRAEFGGQGLQTPNGRWSFDTMIKVQCALFSGNTTWVQGRGSSGQPFFTEIGTQVEIVGPMKIFCSAANLDDLQRPWPDPNGPNGRIFWLGIDGSI